MLNKHNTSDHEHIFYSSAILDEDQFLLWTIFDKKIWDNLDNKARDMKNIVLPLSLKWQFKTPRFGLTITKVIHVPDSVVKQQTPGGWNRERDVWAVTQPMAR